MKQALVVVLLMLLVLVADCQQTTGEDHYEILIADFLNNVAGEVDNLAEYWSKNNEEKTHEKLKYVLLMDPANRTRSPISAVDENKIGSILQEVFSSSLYVVMNQVQQAFKAITKDEIASRAIGATPVRRSQKMSREEQYGLIKADLLYDVANELDNLTEYFTRDPEENPHEKLIDVLRMDPSSRTRSPISAVVDENKIDSLEDEVLSSDKERYESLKADLINDVACKLDNVAKGGTKYTKKGAHERLRDISLMVISDHTQSLGRIVDENNIDNLVNEVLRSDKVQHAYNSIVEE